MTKQHFSFKEIFMFGWAKTQQHAWFIVLTFIIMGIITSAVKFVPILGGLVGFLVSLSLSSISLVISRDHHFTFADLFTPLLSKNRVLKYVGLSLLYMIPIVFALNVLGIGISSGTTALATLGVILSLIALYSAIKFMFFPFVVIDHENAKFIELIKMSNRLTEDNFLPMAAFFVTLCVLNALGALALGFGLLITTPISAFAVAHMYNRIKEHHVA